jgi:hypothetical protein
VSGVATRSTSTLAAVLLLGSCAAGPHPDRYVQVFETSVKTRAALERCLTAKFEWLGTPRVVREETRSVLEFESASPFVRVVINEYRAAIPDVTEANRSIEVWRAGPIEKRLWRDTLACL